MGPRYRRVSARIWCDARFRALSDDAKFIFLLLLTHTHMTSLGAIHASAASLADTLRWSLERFGKPFGELLERPSQNGSLGIVEYDPEACLLVLPNYLRHNPPCNPNQAKAWAGLIDELPECELLTLQLQRVKMCMESLGEQFVKPFLQGTGDSSANSMPILDLDLELDLEKEKSVRVTHPKQDFSEELEDLKNAWNTMAAKCDCPAPAVPTIRGFAGGKRRKTAVARMKDPGWLDDYVKAIVKIPGSDFLCGRTPRKGWEHWRANITFFLRPDTVARILEGEFDSGQTDLAEKNIHNDRSPFDNSGKAKS